MSNEREQGFSYVMRECGKVCPFPIGSDCNGQIKIKVQAEHGETKWFNVTGEKFHAIECILLEGE